mmetsp:Transcript_2084/g.4067  ORF Transcript_2084/g.4067 Transcript_2084/m.4067 type:complete len:570 (-) Transcript_2084:96-1805(-)
MESLDSPTNMTKGLNIDAMKNNAANDMEHHTSDTPNSTPPSSPSEHGQDSEEHRNDIVDQEQEEQEDEDEDQQRNGISLSAQDPSHAPVAPVLPNLSRAVQTKLRWLMQNVIEPKVPRKHIQEQVAREAVSLYRDHVNSAFLDFRKAVEAQPQGRAVIEWSDKGNCFYDIHGEKYIDMLGGYGIYSVGHRNDRVLSAVQHQLEKQALHSQEMVDPLRSYLADIITKLARGHEEVLPGDLQYAFFTNSGTESVEGCLKAATLATGRHKYIGMIGGFHGKSIGSLGGTSKDVFREPFTPVLAHWEHVPFGDADALEQRLQVGEFTGDQIAAVFIEPILGEGGIILPPDGYLEKARELCDRYDTMLIFDEIQTGMGRTGTLFACQYHGVQPDLMALAKGFGGGVMPIGAVLGNAKAWEEFNKNPFLHTTTFGGNPLAFAAALATIQVLLEDELPRKACLKGNYLLPKLRALQEEFPDLLVEARGRGLMIGLEFTTDEIGYAISKELFHRHVLIGGTLINSKTLRVEPPLTVLYGEMDEFVNALRGSLEVTQEAMLRQDNIEEKDVVVASDGL